MTSHDTGEPLPQNDAGDEVYNLAYALVTTVRTWDDLFALLMPESSIILSSLADRLGLALQDEDDPEENEDSINFLLKQLVPLLYRCCEDGVMLAMEEFEMPLVSRRVDPQAVFESYSRF